MSNLECRINLITVYMENVSQFLLPCIPPFTLHLFLPIININHVYLSGGWVLIFDLYEWVGSETTHIM